MAISKAAELHHVADITARLQAMLDRAGEIKPQTAVDPPLIVSKFSEHIAGLHDGFTEKHDQTYKFATIETAARDIFYPLVSSKSIDDPAFVDVWNLLDILLMCGDQGKCTPELVCWLVEELLDSQTTLGCRIVFDYLESRRERLAQNDFHKKNLVFLRSCNELLRRLSRAEDAIFCGRVFFFLFQTFPLGDKSSVNLRGEFHVENVTKFEESETAPGIEKMEVDAETSKSDITTPTPGTPQPSSRTGRAVPIKVPPKKVEEEVLSNSDLYPIFWRLQQDFSDPTRLFASENFQGFKKGLASTIAKFKSTTTVVQTKAAEDGQRGVKRRRISDPAETSDLTGDQDHFVNNYNPKYLTSRDLFDLELTDLAFQRHILGQALILIDFLLSLKEKSKKLLATLDLTNKSMLYNFTLNEDDTKWATATRSTITSYLSQTQEGRLFNRMVDTVLARDKNWVRWKVESCPSIVRDSVTTESELAARKGAQDVTRVRRVPPKPVGAMDLSFLDEGHGGGLDALKDPERYTAPSREDLILGIKNDELDLDMAMDDAEKASLENAMANKRWRVLRQTRATQLRLLDKVEPGKDLDDVFRPAVAPADEDTDVPLANDLASPNTTHTDLVEVEHGAVAADVIVASRSETEPVLPEVVGDDIADDTVAESTQPDLAESGGGDGAVADQPSGLEGPEGGS